MGRVGKKELPEAQRSSKREEKKMEKKRGGVG